VTAALRRLWRRRAVRLGAIGVSISFLLVVLVDLLIARHEHVPEDLLRLVRRTAEEVDLDPDLGEALVRVESGGDPRAVSPKGALGLTQLMPSTGRWLAERERLALASDDDLFDPRTNLRLGLGYLASLLRRYEGDERLAIAAYNAGPGRVDRWRSEHPDLGTDDLVARVAFDETRRHVDRVIRTRDQLRRDRGR